MKHIGQIIKQFKNLKEYTEFLESLVEADGSEISRGKDPNDESKMEKGREEAEQEAPPEGGGEAGMEAGAEEPVIDPVAAPGSQIAVGNKDTKDADDPKAVKIEISGNKEKINMKPSVEINNNNIK